MERESLTKSLIAAAIIIIVVLAGYFYFYSPKSDNTSNSTTTTSTTGDVKSNDSNKSVATNSSSGTASQESSNSNTGTDSNNSSSATSNSAPSGTSTSNSNAKSISSIDQSWKGNNVTISAVVIKKYDSNKNSKTNKFMTIADPNKRSVTMKAVLFDTGKNSNPASALDSAYKNGNPITISGKFDVYKGELEIIVKNVGN